MSRIVDFHTHRLEAVEALISVDPRHFAPQPGKWYSVGYHPWDAVDRLTRADFDLLEQCAVHPQVLAIGETGMDALRGAALDIQAGVFVKHLALAGQVGKPVVAHMVRTSRPMLDARRKAGLDGVPLVIHGMRGNAHVAATLLEGGCYLSFGARFNPDALRATPLDRLLLETDDASIGIGEVAARAATTLGLTPAAVMATVAANTHRLLRHTKRSANR